MKRFYGKLFLILPFLAVILTSCEAIGSIFKAGVWTGVVVIVAIIALVIFVIGKMSSKK